MTQQFPGFIDPQDILGESPELTFFSFQDQFGGQGSPGGGGQNQRNFFRGQFRNFFNEFLGIRGQGLREGRFPTDTFQDFMGGIDFGQRFAQIAPSLRGAGTAQFAPSTRFLQF